MLRVGFLLGCCLVGWCGLVSFGQAAILTTYSFTSSPYAAPTSTDPLVTATNVTTSGQFTISTSSGTAYLSGADSASTLAQAIIDADYLQFTITPAAGQVLNLQSFIFDHKGSLNVSGPAFNTSLSVFASLNGFATAPVAGDAIGTSTATQTVANGTQVALLADDVTFSLSAPQFQNLTSATTVTFRIYGFDDSALSGNFGRADDIRVVGVSATAVPEPSGIALAASAVGLLVWRRRRV